MEQEKCFSAYFQKLFFNKVTEKDNVFASVSYNREKRKIRLTEGCEDKCTHEQSILVGEVEFKIRMEYYPEYGAVGWKTTVTNCSRTKSGKLSDIAILDFNIPLPAGEKMIHKGISGDVCGSESFFPFENSVACGESVFVKPKGGKSSNTSFPFFDLCSENDGLIFGIGWTGVWFYKIKRQESSVSVKAGLPEADFYLEAQESLDLPSILVMAYEGGNREAHNRFRRLIRDHYSPKIRFGDEMKMPFSLQTFDRYTYTVPSWNTEESQLQTMEYANRCGNTDTFWMDALWFTGGFPAGVGNYTFREGFPEGFKNISQILHKEGKRLMVWFEPERVVGGTQMSREHPELLMQNLGYVFGTWGNVSVRLDDDRILMTPSKLEYEKMIPEDLVVMTLEGEILSGSHLPTSERELHKKIMKIRPDIQAVIHTHSPYAMAASTLDKGIPPISEEMCQLIGGSIPISREFVPSEQHVKLGNIVADSLGMANAVLIRNHGSVCCGTSLVQARVCCQVVEKSAKMYLHLLGYSKINLVPSELVEAGRKYYLHSYGKY